MKKFGHYEDIPIEQRREDAILVALMSAVLAATLCIGGWVEDVPAYFGLAAFCMLVGTGLAVHFFRKKQMFVPSPEPPTALSDEGARREVDAGAALNQPAGHGRRFGPMALLAVAAALASLAIDGTKRLLSLVVSGLIILLVLGILVALPVPVAIVLGALIIAGAIRG
ncbi:MAG: hypothetical protein JNM54_08155 [Candidatus Accumulibacter sp.]|uniref:hypothetical protein n=1 Tax=Accumulibacter sp. TaxID=2053492 RepID=UPI001A3846A5|nr:hypothetical protein [Accumulibacter sp.]MBL8367876.1 hypothetical protein [Accumulibacter sp.]